jgi:hypothetical protein
MLLFLTSGMAIGQVKSHSHDTEATPALMKVEKWFAAWELVSKKIYGIKTLQPVEFVFFDSTHVYSTSKVSIPNGELVEGPKMFGDTLPWKKAMHHGELTLPDNQVIPIGLMSFASPLDSTRAFFVMPLPDYWEATGVSSKELGLENLMIGVFLHEFSHTQQMRNFGKQLTFYEQNNSFEVDFSDDIIQEYFEKDSIYQARFRVETRLLYLASKAKDKASVKKFATLGLNFHESRQKIYFTGAYKNLQEIDDFFLTMEGIGQYSMYVWFIHPKGGKLSKEKALAGIWRGGKWWSQDEGLVLFLILARLSKPKKWSELMFGTEMVSVVALIRGKLKHSKAAKDKAR